MILLFMMSSLQNKKASVPIYGFVLAFGFAKYLFSFGYQVPTI